MTDVLIETLASSYLACLVMVFLLKPLFAASIKKAWLRFALNGVGTAVLCYLFVGLWEKWLPPLALAFSILVVQIISALLSRKKENRDTILHFFGEQGGLLLLNLGVVTLLYQPNQPHSYWFQQFPVESKLILIGLFGLIFLVPFGGALIGALIKPFQDQLGKRFQPGHLRPVTGLSNGGTVIGYLERILIAIFILTGEFSGVGFLVAAKSIFRFGELKDGDNRKQAEYIIIGTFASFLLAIIVSLCLRALLGLKPIE